jgi:hypothetical protein
VRAAPEITSVATGFPGSAFVGYCREGACIDGLLLTTRASAKVLNRGDNGWLSMPGDEPSALPLTLTRSQNQNPPQLQLPASVQVHWYSVPFLQNGNVAIQPTANDASSSELNGVV